MDDTQSAQILQMQNRHYTYIIMKVMYSPGHHQNDFVETQALGCMKYETYSEAQHYIQKPVGKVLLYMYMHAVIYIYTYIYYIYIIYIYVLYVYVII